MGGCLIGDKWDFPLQPDKLGLSPGGAWSNNGGRAHDRRYWDCHLGGLAGLHQGSGGRMSVEVSHVGLSVWGHADMGNSCIENERSLLRMSCVNMRAIPIKWVILSMSIVYYCVCRIHVLEIKFLWYLVLSSTEVLCADKWAQCDDKQLPWLQDYWSLKLYSAT